MTGMGKDIVSSRFAYLRYNQSLQIPVLASASDGCAFGASAHHLLQFDCVRVKVSD